MATRPEALREPVLEPVTLPGGQIVEVEVVPWSGLVDINGATPELLAVLFQHAAGLSQGAAMAMAQTVRQARDAMRQQSGSADRKSTRLNSSHLVISYAVFCLKKTNTIH